MIIQFCGLSGSGKTTLAMNAGKYFEKKGIEFEVIDADEYRKLLCADLGFTKEDRNTNIRRLAFVANKLSAHNVITVICAINPYDDIRKEVAVNYRNVKTVFIKCSIEELRKRDTKGMYARALLPDSDARKINNLSGVNDPFEPPAEADLVIETDKETVDVSTKRLIRFIEENLDTPIS